MSCQREGRARTTRRPLPNQLLRLLCTPLVLIFLISASAHAQEPAQEGLVDEGSPDLVESDVSDVPDQSPDQTTDSEVADSESTSPIEKVNRWYLEVALRARVNSLGLTLFADAGYRIPLYKQPNPLYDLAQIDLSVTTQISPAYVWAGPQLEIAPLSILVLRGTVQGLYYFGTFGYVYPFGMDGNWSSGSQKDVADQGLSQSTGGYMAEAAATLQAMAFNVVARVNTQYSWYFVNVSEAYVEPFNDLLLAPDDGVWLTTALLGYVLFDQLVLGALWEHSATRETAIKRDLAGIVVLWDIPPQLWAWGQPEIASLLGMYVNDPYREKQVTWGIELSLRF